MPYRDKEKQYARQKMHRDKNAENLWNFLTSSSCKDCNTTDPRVLEFDHLGDKSFNVSRAVSGSTRSWETILKEISKCDIVCANCHRIRTQERGNYKRNQAFVTQRTE
jgi:hypothetical protein